MVLDIRVLSEEDANQWLSKFKVASSSIENKDDKLTPVVYEITRRACTLLAPLHIVGAPTT